MDLCDKRKIKVLHILYTLDFGGAESFLMNVYRCMDQREMEFDFLVHGEGKYDAEIIAKGGKVYYLKGYIRDVGIFKYRKMLKKFLLSHKTAYDIIHVHVDQTSGAIIPLVKKYTSAAAVAHSHCINNNNGMLISMYKRFLQNRLLRYSDHRLACSAEAGKWLYKGKKFYVIQNGIDMGRFRYLESDREQIRQELAIGPEVFLIGCVGRLEKVKNHFFLLNMFSEYHTQYKDSKLMLIGSGTLRQEIEDSIHRLGLDDAVILLGSRADVHRYYSAMDLFVLPSFAEGFGIVAIEAQANGLGVIASMSVPREARISDHMIFLPLQIDPWIAAIRELKDVGHGGHIDIDGVYSAEKSSQRLFRFYKKIVYRNDIRNGKER